MKPAMMWWDHRTLIRADLVESIQFSPESFESDKWVVIIKLSGHPIGEGQGVKKFATEAEAHEEFNELYSKWTEALRDR